MNKKTIIGAIIIIVIFISIPVGIYLMQNQQILRSRATEGSGKPGDLDGNNCISLNDYNFWVNNYSSRAGTDSSVRQKYEEWLQKYNEGVLCPTLLP